MKIIKRMIIIIVCIPIALILVVIAFEIAGMIVNHTATWRQTEKLKNVIEKELTDAEIIDTYSETGNTSGTGNHVDMLSVVVFRTNESISDIEIKLKDYYEFDEWGCWVEKLDTMAEIHEPGSFWYQIWDEMDISEDSDNCYLMYLNQSAPFADNIEGH